MDYKQLGSSGLRVSEMCLGAMTFGRADWGATPEESRRVFEAYVEAGGNFVDTANNYADGRSEEIVGELLNDDRGRFVLATKYTAPIRSRDVNAFGNHRKSLVGSLDQSLRRLRTDYIDLLWVHVWDGVTPVEEMMRALDDQVRAGKVLYLGISDVPAWAVAEANALAQVRGWTPFSAIQIEYSLVERTVERELIPLAARRGLSVLAWGPLGGGLLTGKYVATEGAAERAEGRLQEGDRRLTQRNLEIAGVVRDVAAQLQCPPAQVALAWLRSRGRFVIPIVGARTAEQLRTSLGYLDVELSGEQLQSLESVSAVSMGFPGEMLARFGIQP